MEDDTNNLAAALAALISQIQAVLELWKNSFGARYYEPDLPATYLDSSPATDRELEKYPQRYLRLKQIQEEYDDLLRRAGKFAGAREDQDPLVFCLNLLRRESARFYRLGTDLSATANGFINNVLDATVELLQRLKRTGSLPLPAAQAAAAVASADETQPAATFVEPVPSDANESITEDDDNALASVRDFPACGCPAASTAHR